MSRIDNINVVRNVRMPLSLDTDIRRIAEYEDRTISKVIQRLLQRAVREYLEDYGYALLKKENEDILLQEAISTIPTKNNNTSE